MMIRTRCFALSTLAVALNLVAGRSQDQRDLFFTSAPIPKIKDDPLPAGAIARVGKTFMRLGDTLRYEWMEFSKDGDLLLGAKDDHELKRGSSSANGLDVWSLSTGQKVRTINYGESLGFARVNSDGKTLMMIVNDSGRNPDLGAGGLPKKDESGYGYLVAHQVAIETGKIINSARLKKIGNIFLSLRHCDVSHDGSLFAMIEYGSETLHIISTKTGEILSRIDLAHVKTDGTLPIYFSPDDKVVYVPCRNVTETRGIIHRYEIASKTLLPDIETSASHSMGLSFSRDSKRLAYAFHTTRFAKERLGMKLVVHDITTNKPILEKNVITSRPTIEALLSPDGQFVMLVSSGVNVIIRVATGEEIAHLPNSYNNTPPAVSNDGTIASSHFGTVGLWNIKTGERHPRSALPFDPYTSIHFTKTGVFRTMADEITDTVRKDQKAYPWPVPGFRNGIADDISPDGGRAAVYWKSRLYSVLGADHEIQFVDIDQKKIIRTLRIPGDTFFESTFSHDNRYYYRGIAKSKSDPNPRIIRIEVETGIIDKEYRDVAAVYGSENMSVSPNGQYLAINEGKKIQIWDTATAKVIYDDFHLMAEKPYCQSIQFSDTN